MDKLEPGLMVGDFLRVQQPNDPKSESYYSRIEDIAEKTLVMTWPTAGGMPLSSRPDQTLTFFIISEDNAYSFNGTVDNTIGEPMPTVAITIASDVQRVQRRQDFRVKCLIPIEIFATLPPTSSVLNPATLRLKTNTYDLSASGVSLRTTRAIPEGTRPVIKLSLPDGELPIKTSSRVAHCFTAPENPDKFHIGIQFMALEENSRARIVRFVYRTQLKRIRI